MFLFRSLNEYRNLFSWKSFSVHLALEQSLRIRHFQNEALGRSRGELATKIQLVCDGK
jgi:hypothetical protein